jgi:type IX secretion system PorP/SprF family membrane protein
MMKFNLILIVLFVFAFSDAKAQQDEQMSMYMYNKLYYNPAYAGSRDAISAIGIARFQWVNFDGAPNTQWFSVHAPLLQKTLGVGAHFVNDRIGNRSRTAVYGDLSSSIAVNKKSSRIAIGLSGGFDIVGYDFSNVIVNDQNDVYFGEVYSEVKPNIGAGIYYYSDKHYISISSPRILEANSSNIDTIIDKLNARHFFISGGYAFKLNSVFSLIPSTMIKYTPNAPLTIDVNASLRMYDQFNVGLLYRYHESMGVNLVYELKKKLSIGYVYDFPINGLRTYQNGSHEIFIRYDFMPKKSVFTSPRYF